MKVKEQHGGTVGNAAVLQLQAPQHNPELRFTTRVKFSVLMWKKEPANKQTNKYINTFATYGFLLIQFKFNSGKKHLTLAH